MIKVRVDRDFADDLRQLKEIAPKQAAFFGRLVSELAQFRNVEDVLLTNRDRWEAGGGYEYEVCALELSQRLWRIKSFAVRKVGRDKHRSLLSRRLIYYYDEKAFEIVFLAIMPRAINYEKSPEFVKRINAACVRRGIPLAYRH